MRWRRPALLLLCLAGSAQAEDYWSYRHGDLEVLASGSKAYALSIAQRLNALDEALMTIFGQEHSEPHIPTHVYALPAAELQALNPLWADRSGAYMAAGPLEAVLVMQSENEGPARLDDVYRDRALAWLDEHGLARMPDWFVNGYVQIVAGATIDNDRLLLGQALPEKMAELTKVRWYPMEQLLRRPSTDPLFNGSPADKSFYDAECWWIVHLIMFDGSLGEEVVNYLKLLRQGVQADIAYATSFRVSYDALDERLRKLRRILKPKTATLDLTALPDTVQPVQLDDAAVRARLAELTVLVGDSSERAGQRVAAALAGATGDQRAQLARVRYSLAAKRYDQLAGALAPLLQRDDLDDYTSRALAVQLVSLADQRNNGMPGLETFDTAELHARARRLLTRAMELNEGDPIARFELGRLYASEGDVKAIRELLPAVEKACADRPYNLALSSLLMRLYTLGGTKEQQLKFALRTYELSDSSLQRKSVLARARRLNESLNPPAEKKPKRRASP